MTSLFDEIERTRLGPARHDERQFEYLNVSAREAAGQVRKLLDKWFSRYPIQSQHALATRIRSRSDIDFDSATFELALHELIMVLGHRVVSIEPVVSNGRSPDFLVEDKDGGRFFLEAVSAADISDAARSAEARLNVAVQVLDEASSPDFHLHLVVQGTPSTAVPQRQMQRSFQSWIDALSFESGPWIFEFGEVTFTVTVMAPRSRSGPDSRAISSRSFGGGASAPHQPIREALRGKANRYGTLDHPFVIAINASVMGQDESDFLAALLGSEIVQVPLTAVGAGEPVLTRAQDGLWIDHRGIRRRGVSGVLFFDRFGPWTANLRSPLLVLNPWTNKAIAPMDRIARIEVVDERLKKFPGQSLQELFELDIDWLEPE